MTEGFEQLERQLGAAQRRLADGRARPWRRLAGGLAPALAVAVTLAVVAVVLLAGRGGERHPRDAKSDGSSGHRAQPTSGEGSRRVLPCREAIGTQPPPPAMQVVLGVVALPAGPGVRRALQTSRTGARGQLFAKAGLWVRSGARVTLVVPTGLRGQVSIGWGNADEGHVGSIVIDPRCRKRDQGWIDFAGGFETTKPRCAPVTVVAGGERRSVRIGIGRACPGQLPPPTPTEG